MISVEELLEKLERFGADAMAWKARALAAEVKLARLAAEQDESHDYSALVDRLLAQAVKERDEAARDRDIWKGNCETAQQHISWQTSAVAVAETRLAEAVEVVKGMVAEWDKLTRYGSPMAKAANERLQTARAFLSSFPAQEDGG